MNLWVVNHGTDRKWLKVMVRTPKRRDVTAFIFGEWNAGPVTRESGYTVPRAPREGPWSNTDPLVIGRDMFFSYCKKGKKKTRSNLRGPNSLDAGDLVLFGGQRAGRIIVDATFVVGEYREWPSDEWRVPDWDLESIAARVHFHDAAHRSERQHPEVHSGRPVPARSYRGRRFEEDGDLFSWVPARETPGEPFGIAAGGQVFRQWFGLYDKPAIDLFKGSFPVIEDIPVERGRTIFRGLMDAARSGGYMVAVRADLIGDTSSPAREAETPATGTGCGS